MRLRLALSFLALCASPAFAKGLLVSPSSFTLTTPPSSPVEARLLLRATTADATRVAISVEPFGIDAEGKPLRGMKSPRSLPERWNLSSAFALLEAGNDEFVTLVFNPPEGAEGSYWAAVTLEVEPVSREGQRGELVDVVTRLVVPVFVTIEGSAKPRLRIEDLAARGGADGMEVSATLENDGNSLIKTTAHFVVEEKASGVELATGEVRDILLLPGSSRLVRVSLQPARSDARLAALLFVPFGTEKGMIARGECAAPNR